MSEGQRGAMTCCGPVKYESYQHESGETSHTWKCKKCRMAIKLRDGLLGRLQAALAGHELTIPLATAALSKGLVK